MRIILGVSGGIAAYKAILLLRLLREEGHDVRVIPTTASLEFVGRATWEALSGQSAADGVFEDITEVAHVRLGQDADLVIVAPATADLLSRAATGRADDLLTSTLLTARCPVLFAPAMHTEMWEHPATEDNIAMLRERGNFVLDPASGRLTGADSGPGRLPDPEKIAAAALALVDAPTSPGLSLVSNEEETSSPPLRFPLPRPATHDAHSEHGSSQQGGSAGGDFTFSDDVFEEGDLSQHAHDLAGLRRATSHGRGSAAHGSTEKGSVAHSSFTQDLAGRTVTISAGGTIEPIDPVRFLGNRSSGRQGIALAEAARDRGANVHLIAANVSLPLPEGIDVTRVETAQELQTEVRQLATSSDVIVMAAAVSDFRPAALSEAKIKKGPGSGPAPIELVENPDILAGLVRDRSRAGQVIVGFAAETGDEDGNVLDHGRAKAKRKGADLLAINDVSDGRAFGTKDNEATIVDREGDTLSTVSGTKGDVAHGILDTVLVTLT